jgi:hypothetical protein
MSPSVVRLHAEPDQGNLRAPRRQKVKDAALSLGSHNMMIMIFAQADGLY